MYRFSFPKPPIEYKPFTIEEWRAYPKDHFNSVIKSWCNVHNYVEYIEVGRSVPAKLPYRKGDDKKGEDPTLMYVA